MERICHIRAFVCKDTETSGKGKGRHDDSAREQSGGEGPREKRRQRRKGWKDSEGQRAEENGEEGMDTKLDSESAPRCRTVCSQPVMCLENNR